MDSKRVIGIGLVMGLFFGLALMVYSQVPDFGSLPPPPAFPGAAGAEQQGADARQLPQQQPFPAAAASPPAARAALPGDISGPNGVPDGRCVNLYDIWALGPQVGVCQLPAGSPLDVDGDSCFTEADLPTIMQNVNVRCS